MRLAGARDQEPAGVDPQRRRAARPRPARRRGRAGAGRPDRARERPAVAAAERVPRLRPRPGHAVGAGRSPSRWSTEAVRLVRAHPDCRPDAALRSRATTRARGGRGPAAPRRRQPRAQRGAGRRGPAAGITVCGRPRCRQPRCRPGADFEHARAAAGRDDGPGHPGGDPRAPVRAVLHAAGPAAAGSGSPSCSARSRRTAGSCSSIRPRRGHHVHRLLARQRRWRRTPHEPEAVASSSSTTSPASSTRCASCSATRASRSPPPTAARPAWSRSAPGPRHRAHRRAHAEVSGLEVLAAAREQDPDDAGHPDDRAGLAADRHQRGERGRLLLHPEAVPQRRAGGDPAPRRRAPGAPGREPAAQAGDPPARQAAASRRPIGKSQRFIDVLQAGRDVAPTDSHGAHPGRERHRQGSRGALHPRPVHRARRARSSPSTAARCPRACSRASCSAT